MTEPTNLNDLAALARTTKSTRYRRALASATDEIETLRTRVKELEGIIDTSHHESTDPEAQ